MKFAVIIPAAGQGLRMGTTVKKQYLMLNGMPVLAWSIIPFLKFGAVVQIIVVVPSGDLEQVRKILKPHLPIAEIAFVEGGKRRQDSVFNGLQHVNNQAEFICIHDGARPLVTEKQIKEVLLAAGEYGGAIPGLPLTDTLKEVNPDGSIRATLSRECYRLAQTPQFFRRELIQEAYERARRLGVEATDDAYLLEILDARVQVVPGDPANIKITDSFDLKLAELLLNGGG